jgi:PAS domain S-box-containing protein
MKDENKTKEQLIKELAELQQRIAELEESETERKRAEEVLRQSEEKFRLSFENATDAIFWGDTETGLIIKCNEAAEALLEKKREEIIGYPQTMLHPLQKSKYYSKMFKEHIARKGAIDDEAEVITKSGKIKPVHITASLTLIGGRQIIQGIFRDITERKKMEKELKGRVEELEKFYDIAIDRELRMKQLKEEIKKLKSELSQHKK